MSRAARRRSSGRSKPASSGPDAVKLAFVHDVSVSYSWHESVMQLFALDLSRHQRILNGGYIAMRAGTDGLIAARNKVVEWFLEEPEGAPWLFWTDTDMGFEPDTLEKLLSFADAEERPIVGGLCFAQREVQPDGQGGFRTRPSVTIFDWVDGAKNGEEQAGPTGFHARASYPVNGLTRCAGTGSALIVVHRGVFERINEKFGAAWYDRAPNPTQKGQLISEDLSFCLRAGSLGIPVHVFTGARSTHHKSLWLAEPDFWRQAVPPPATERVAVLVPVMRRPGNAAPFMDSLRASTGLATCYAIADRDDEETIKAWREAGATVLHPVPREDPDGRFRPGRFSEKVNDGFRQTREPWIFIVGDDVRFHAGWLDHAVGTATERHLVIGTNDLSNPRVMRGEHATHLLIRREYVDAVGASWDGPGVVCHETYRHWFVDDEIVTAARMRGAFAMALGSLVEHMHPIFKKGEDDEVYQLGQRHAETDKLRFEERLRRAQGQAARERAAEAGLRVLPDPVAPE